MTDGTFTLVDARGRKYLTAKERERFLAAASAHPKPGVQTLARSLAMTGCRASEALGIRACDVDLELRELRISTLKRRTVHWRAVPVPEDLVHALELVHRPRRLQARARGANRPLWLITRQTANRQVGAIKRTAGIEGPQACPPGLRRCRVRRWRPAPNRRRGSGARVADDDRDLHDGDRSRGPRAPTSSQSPVASYRMHRRTSRSRTRFANLTHLSIFGPLKGDGAASPLSQGFCAVRALGAVRDPE